MIPIDDEKASMPYVDVGKTDVGTGMTAIIEEDVNSSDGDDALKLAGTHAHHFDEKYYARLRWKIVSHEIKRIKPKKLIEGLSSGPSCHADPRVRLLYSIPGQEYLILRIDHGLSCYGHLVQ